MLVLSRRVGESIIIGDNIQVRVLKIENGVVKLGIMAPDDVRIYREEVYNAIAQHNKSVISQETALESVMKLKEVIKSDKDRR